MLAPRKCIGRAELPDVCPRKGNYDCCHDCRQGELCPQVVCKPVSSALVLHGHGDPPSKRKMARIQALVNGRRLNLDQIAFAG
jgi:hypothetical protein